MDYKSILYTKSDTVLTITLNRPNVYNALNEEMIFELQDAFSKATIDQDIRVIVLTGIGKAFCSGQDLKEFLSNPNPSFIDSIYKRYNPLIKAMREIPKPIICRLNGIAAGAGCSLVLACDFVIAHFEATLVQAFVGIGLVPDSGSSYFLPRATSSKFAFEAATMGNKISATRAFEIGMINRVCNDDEFEYTVNDIVNYYKNAPTKAIGLIKKMLNNSTNSNLDTQLDFEAFCQEIAGNTNDFKEGTNAFIEKRKPVFNGN
ncbi:MAG: enoyl-CoA hydratase/isomerase family protein [Bacteroidetes bacterium]|nr:enoyl-CoA hydratase/isomerase family protein [Bacteroidota bacterium]